MTGQRYPLLIDADLDADGTESLGAVKVTQ